MAAFCAGERPRRVSRDRVKPASVISRALHHRPVRAKNQTLRPKDFKQVSGIGLQVFGRLGLIRARFGGQPGELAIDAAKALGDIPHLLGPGLKRIVANLWLGAVIDDHPQGRVTPQKRAQGR